LFILEWLKGALKGNLSAHLSATLKVHLSSSLELVLESESLGSLLSLANNAKLRAFESAIDYISFGVVFRPS